MTLSCKSAFQKRSYAPGVYINEVTVADVQDISGSSLPFLSEPVDIGLKLFLDIGRDFQPEFIIAGNFKRDDADNVVGWGSAFVVQEALSKLGYDGDLETGNKIPFPALQAIVGQKFLRLSYISGIRHNGKFRYSDWNTIATPAEGPDALAARFRRSLSKGYPRNYRPELLTDCTATIEPAATEEEPVF